mmetsp:Transcript_13333/g.56801  ORF Transcript_13333/g.56801 Transcript_13333/m.56801 type:complete len:288 (+) Transcript_13333:905-1768(+)
MRLVGASRASRSCAWSKRSSSSCARCRFKTCALSSMYWRTASSRAEAMASENFCRSRLAFSRFSRPKASTSLRVAARASSRSRLSLTHMSYRRGSSPWSRRSASRAAFAIMCVASRTRFSASVLSLMNPDPAGPSPSARVSAAAAATSVVWCASWYGDLYALPPRAAMLASVSLSASARLESTSASSRGVGETSRCSFASASRISFASASASASAAFQKSRFRSGLRSGRLSRRDARRRRSEVQRPVRARGDHSAAGRQTSTPGAAGDGDAAPPRRGRRRSAARRNH